MNIKQGGKWLGAARSWLQWHTRNGDSVTWGSNDVIEPHLTVKMIEELAADVAEAAVEEETGKQFQMLKEAYNLLFNAKGIMSSKDTSDWDFDKLRWMSKYKELFPHNVVAHEVISTIRNEFENSDWVFDGQAPTNLTTGGDTQDNKFLRFNVGTKIFELKVSEVVQDQSKSPIDNITRMINALKVMVYDRKNYYFLRNNDPKALEQILEALKAIDPHDTKTDEIVERWNREYESEEGR